MNKIITKTVMYRGREIPVEELKPNSNIKVIVECKHGQRELKWVRRNRLCKQCSVEAGVYNTCKKGRKITWGDKISKAKKGKDFSEEHKKALSVAQYKCDEKDWPGFYVKSEIHSLRDSQEYQDFRREVLKRDNYKCVITGMGGNLEVHHLNGVSLSKEEALMPSNAVTLHASVHAKFHLVYGRGNNTKEQFEEFRSNYKKDNKVYFLCGQSGVGKTTVASKLKDKFTVVSYDSTPKEDIVPTIHRNSTGKPILLDIPVLISTYYKKIHETHDVQCIFIIENVDVVKDRIVKRGGKPTASIEKRHKRMRSLYKKYGVFKGTSAEVEQYLSNLVL